MFYNFIKEILFFFNEMSIFLIFGFFIAGIIHIFISEEIVLKHLGKGNFISVIKASLFGIPIPICSCGVIPLAVSLKRKGASKGATISFIISTPQIGADSFLLTYSLIGWIFAVFRIIAAFFTAMFAGLFTNIFSYGNNKKENKIMEIKKIKTTIKSRFKTFFQYIEIELFGSIANYLLIGIIVAGAISAFVPDDFFLNYFNNQFLSMLIMLIIGIPMYVCATASTPIAASLLLKGISPGAALIFLLAGPATNAITFSAVGKVLGKKTLFIYLLSIILITLLLGWGINFLKFNNNIEIIQMHNHQILPSWLHILGSTILLLMFISYYFRKYLLKYNKNITKLGKKEIIVNGMTCNHCTMSVKKAVESIEGTNNVKVNLENKKVYFDFLGNNLEDIKKAIIENGYRV